MGADPAPRDTTTFGVFAFRIGPAAPEFIRDDRLRFYSGVVAAVSGAPASSVVPDAERTIPISASELSGAAGGTVRKKLLARYQSWKHRPEIVVVDAMFGQHRIMPGKIELQLAAAMVYLAPRWNLKRVILLVDSLPPVGEATRRIYQARLDDGSLTVIDREKRILGDGPANGELESTYRILDKMRIDDAVMRLERKMIRRLGHFRRDFGDSFECSRYYFDGSKCVKDIAALIVHHVRTTAPNSRVILFEPSRPPWLDKAIQEASAELHATPISIDEALEAPDSSRERFIETPLLVVPLVDTGRTIETFRVRWRAALGEFAFPPVLSILNAGAGDVPRPNIRIVHGGGDPCEVAFFLSVDRGLELEKPCRMCRSQIPYSSASGEKYQMISAFDFWGMVEQAGWIPEQDVPPDRESAGLVPNFPELFSANGAWIADKALYRICTKLGIEYQTEAILLVAPDEPGARKFAEYIALLHDSATIILIPRSAVRKFREPTEPVDALVARFEEGRPGWFAQLRESSALDRVVFVEEFTLTGGTCAAVTRLVLAVRRTVHAHALICDFRPSTPQGVGEAARVPLCEFDRGVDPGDA